jgi:MFS transporter, DHA1 family, multidrug resistance protein
LPSKLGAVSEDLGEIPAERPDGLAGSVTSLALILGALSAFGSVSIDMYLPSFQAISRDLAASEAQVQLTLAVHRLAA